MEKPDERLPDGGYSRLSLVSHFRAGALQDNTASLPYLGVMIELARAQGRDVVAFSIPNKASYVLIYHIQRLIAQHEAPSNSPTIIASLPLPPPGPDTMGNSRVAEQLIREQRLREQFQQFGYELAKAVQAYRSKHGPAKPGPTPKPAARGFWGNFLNDLKSACTRRLGTRRLRTRR